MDAASSYIQTVLQKLRHVSNVRDATTMVYDIVIDASQWVSKMRRGDDNWSYYYYDNTILLPELHWGIQFILGALMFSILFRSIRILQIAMWLVVADKLVVTVLRWVFYTLDDPALDFALRYLRGWLRRFVKESGSILNNEGAWKMVVAHAFVRQVPTGISVVRHWIFYRSFALRDKFISEELGAARYTSDPQTEKEFLPRGERWYKRYRERKRNKVDDGTD
jgi:hypothetical protein